MAKRTTKPANSNELDGKEFFAAIAQIEQEKGIKPGYMMEKITQALLSAYRRDHEGVGDNLVCLLYTSPSPRDRQKSRMPSSA